jgi:hypothetical protein
MIIPTLPNSRVSMHSSGACTHSQDATASSGKDPWLAQIKRESRALVVRGAALALVSGIISVWPMSKVRLLASSCKRSQQSVLALDLIHLVILITACDLPKAINIESLPIETVSSPGFPYLNNCICSPCVPHVQVIGHTSTNRRALFNNELEC